MRGRRTPIQKSDSIQLQVRYSKPTLSPAVHCHHYQVVSHQNKSRDRILALLRGSLGETPAIPVGAGSSMLALKPHNVHVCGRMVLASTPRPADCARAHYITNCSLVYYCIAYVYTAFILFILHCTTFILFILRQVAFSNPLK